MFMGQSPLITRLAFQTHPGLPVAQVRRLGTLKIIQWDNLADGPHVPLHQQRTDFWFDQINYTPSPNLILNETALLVDHKDADIHLDSSWADLWGYCQLYKSKGHTNAI